MKIWNGGSQGSLHVHNVHNLSPASYSSTKSPSTLPEVRHALNIQNTDHVLFGDFNLHHPYWNRPSRPTQHAAADSLLDIVGANRYGADITTGHYHMGSSSIV